jgi:hypothetical protein
MIFLAVWLLAFAATGTAAATVATYAYGRNGAGTASSFRSVGQAQRTSQTIWHADGYWWCSEYTTLPTIVAGNPTGYACSSSNPSSNPNGIGYGYAWAFNGFDNTGVYWTAQSNTV